MIRRFQLLRFHRSTGRRMIGAGESAQGCAHSQSASRNPSVSTDYTLYVVLC